MNRRKIKGYPYPLKQKFIYMLCCFLLWSCGHHLKNIENQPTDNGLEQDKTNLPEILFENTTHDFGEVIQGEEFHHTFHFKNIGKSSLIVSDVKTSCGCTISVPPMEPVSPEEESEIPITFNTTHKSGEVTIFVVVSANTYPAQTILTVKAKVKERGL